MKIFQILNNYVHIELTEFTSIEETKGLFAPNIHLVDLPNDTKVRVGWGYVNNKFVKPIPPDGWIYDDDSGVFIPIDENGNPNYPPPYQDNQLINAVDNYTLQLIESGVL